VLPRSTRSSASPPEFFADRCLGKSAPTLLAERGWVIHLISDHFPDDAQAVSDPDWMAYGLSRSWALLTQDERIRRQPAALELLRRHRGAIFCLSSAELPVRARVERLCAHQGAICDAVRTGRGGFFLVHEHLVVRQRR
jgi:PIN like domain